MVQSDSELTHGVQYLYDYESIPVDPLSVTQSVDQYKVYLSKTDTYIPFDQTYQYFASQYPNIQIQVFEDMKHFNHSAGIDTLPQALEHIL